MTTITPVGQEGEFQIPVTEAIANLEAAALGAGDAARLSQQGTLEVEFKDRFDLVTDGDRLSQAAAKSVLRAKFPDWEILAEEQTTHVPTSRCITIDPVDGTTGFSKGGMDWGVLIGMMAQSEPIAGVIHLPCRNLTVTTVRGSGCLLNGQRVILNPSARLEQSILGAELAFFAGLENLGALTRIAGSHCLGLKNAMSTSGNVVDLLLGITGCYVHPGHGKLWDFVPTVLAVQEAGGVVVDFDGNSPRFDCLEPGALIFGANQHIVDEVRTLMRQR